MEDTNSFNRPLMYVADNTECMKFKVYYKEAGIGGFPGMRPGRFWCVPDSKTGD